ncbi:MAG TPA: hypothetical protein VM143_13755 [Acidimicrobiales bacterium]|nr:hypothetical protein [Acidimicrobiales bacterium]
MQRITAKLAAVTFVLSLATVFATSTPAWAHERRLVADKYNFVVGWGDEPTYNGFKNSVQLILSDAAHSPITDLGDTLQVEVISGDQKVTLPIEADFEVGKFGTPGDYRAWIVPTRTGNYTFHVVGTIHGDKIDEQFTSSETTFDPVKDVAELEFPVKDPTTGQLADRVERETKRVDDQLASVTAKAKDGNDKAGTATTLGVIGIIVGALGLVAGGIGLTRKR